MFSIIHYFKYAFSDPGLQHFSKQNNCENIHDKGVFLEFSGCVVKFSLHGQRMNGILFVKTFTGGALGQSIPLPAVARLCAMYQVLCDLSREDVATVSSGALGERLGVGAHNVRKDVSFLAEAGSGGAGYDVERLRKLIASRLGFERERKTCVVGLGRLGSAILRHERLTGEEFHVVAGFDSDINLVETIKTDVSVFPAYEITETVRRLGVEMGILAVPSSAAQDSADRLIRGGVKGIINFTPAVIRTDSSVVVRNVDLTSEFRVLSALMFLKNNSTSQNQ